MYRRICILFLLLTVACAEKLDWHHFNRRAEKTYLSEHPGWMLVRRKGRVTTFVRGDQVRQVDFGAVFDLYQAEAQSSADFFADWTRKLAEEQNQRKRSLVQAESTLVPVLKSADWLKAQDLGAIGSKDLHESIRVWRHEVAPGLYAVLGIHEEGLGFRYVSQGETRTVKTTPEELLKQSVARIEQTLTATSGLEMKNADGRVLVWTLNEKQGAAALILSASFRAQMLSRFKLEKLGVALPLFDEITVFDPSSFVTVKPIRARVRELYDSRNQATFRGLFYLDTKGLTVWEDGRETKSP